MKADQFSSNDTPNASHKSDERERFVGLEIQMPVTLPGYPTENWAGSFVLMGFIEFGLSRENLLCGKVCCGYGLSQAGFVARVKNLPKAFRVLDDVLNHLPHIKPAAVYGWRDTDEMIWRPVWPAQNAPFGARLDLPEMLATWEEFQKAFLKAAAAMGIKPSSSC